MENCIAQPVKIDYWTIISENKLKKLGNSGSPE
jgi:hypothetical protein